jgi:hypothetical protein
MAKVKDSAYYQTHKQDLADIIKRYEALEGQSDFEGLEDPSLSHLLTIDQAFRHPFRPYQRRALYILNELFNIIQDERATRGRSKRAALIADLVETVERKKIPYLGFEMATGSGKTQVMGASLYLLAERFGVRNFLILVGGPASTNIYQKTIRNFSHADSTSIWEDRSAFPFNLFTGENYRDARGGFSFDETSNVNVFVFNIQKFTETSGEKGEKTRKTQKPWETAPWKDKFGNTISLQEYLQNERLVIITDEAHHTQGKASQDIIKGFSPEAVLEFTATADESGGGNKRAQDIVYKYDIRQFLDEGYGKLVHALALDSDSADSGSGIDDYEKRKIITTLLVHLVKREALKRDPKSVIRKALCLIKVKDVTATADKVVAYLREDLEHDQANLNYVREKLLAQNFPVLERFKELWKDAFHENSNELAAELGRIGRGALAFYGDVSKESRESFSAIAHNQVELVVYIKMLDEGIDIPSIYTMAVVKDNATDLVTSIKQIIGRGVRLNKEKRVYDHTEDPWFEQAELLHVICDRGAAFDTVIAAIQSAFGLTERHIMVERSGADKTRNMVKKHLLEKRWWPQLRADLVVREGTKLLELLGDVDGIESDYLDANCFYKGEVSDLPMLKFKPSAFFVELDIFCDPAVYREQLLAVGGTLGRLSSDEDLWKDIFVRTLRLQTTIPDIQPTREIFRKYRERFAQNGVGYYYVDEADHAQARKHFAATFSYFLSNYVEKRYYRLDLNSLGEESRKPLVNCFKDEDIFLPANIAELWTRLADETVAKDMIHSGVPFRGYAHSAYDFVCFDSLPEKRAGEIVNGHLDKYLTVSDARPVWIKNRRQVSLSYGKREYYPDFLVCVGEKMYIIETKGDIYSDFRKNQLLREVEEKTEGKVKPILAFGDWIDRVGGDFQDLEGFLYAAEAESSRRLQTWELEYTPPEAEKYRSYLPSYSAEKAWRRFSKGKAEIRPDGWAKLPDASRKDYAQTCFVLRNRSDFLSHLGPWLIIDGSRKPESGESALFHYSQFDDSYRRGFSVQKCKRYGEQTGGLFTQELWELSADGEAPLRLRPPRDQFDAVGTVVNQE